MVIEPDVGNPFVVGLCPTVTTSLVSPFKADPLFT